jgi:hypothetical protein
MLQNPNYNNYGISKIPNTKNYIVVLKDTLHCEKCNKQYTSVYDKWCKPCLINHLKMIL